MTRKVVHTLLDPTSERSLAIRDRVARLVCVLGI